MKRRKSKVSIRSKLMGICFSSKDDHTLAEEQQLSSRKDPGINRDVKSATDAAAYEALAGLDSNRPSNTVSRAESFDVNILRSPSNPMGANDFKLSQISINVDIFTYEEMTKATKQFRPDYILGEGGFGVVYKGVIDESVRPGYKTTHVAIKELNPDGVQGDREWLTEVNYLGQLSHPNLVKLVGYCCEDDHRLLVYEHMASGSLEKHLFRRAGSTLTWSQRMKIALDAAKGLAFLHCAQRSIIYRDFKTSNILLDKKFSAKLSDFGLAKDGPMGDQTHVSTRVMGTYGYAAPEYVMTGHLTARSDVYGFGVVLLELLLGRRALDKSRPSREHNLVEWARPILNQNKKVLKILDPRLEGQYSSKRAIKVANLAHACLCQNPKGRPLMSEVVALLDTVQSREGNPSVQNNIDHMRSFPHDKSRHPGSREGEIRRSRTEPSTGM